MKKLKVAGQPKIDLKQFGEGKDLNYELQIDCLPSVTLKSFEKFKATSFSVNIEDKIIDEKLKEIANQNKQFEDKNENEKAINGDQVILIIRLQLMEINLKEAKEKVFSLSWEKIFLKVSMNNLLV